MSHGIVLHDSERIDECAVRMLKESGRRVSDDMFENIRAAFPPVEGVGGLLDKAAVEWILDGYASSADTLNGVYREVPAPNYLQQELATVNIHPRVQRIVRGETAVVASFGAGSENYRLMKVGAQFSIDEQDLLDNVTLGTFRLAIREIGQAVRRAVSDLLWSTILGNATLADGTACFDASRGNYGTAALAESDLDTAESAIAGQVGTDHAGNATHVNLEPRYLIVAPDNRGLAKRLARARAVGDSSDLVVRTESRLSDAGVVDPRDDSVSAGNNLNWMVASHERQKAGLVLALLDGKRKPTIRSFALDKGRWGAGFDISLSCAAKLVSGDPFYWSTGTT